MADLTQKDVFVQVRIREETSEGQFNDSLYFTLAQFSALSDANLQVKKQERVNNWVNLVKESKTAIPIEPTKEELAAQKERLLTELNLLQIKIDEKDKIAEK